MLLLKILLSIEHLTMGLQQDFDIMLSCTIYF